VNNRVENHREKGHDALLRALQLCPGVSRAMKSSQIPGILSLAIPWMLSTAAIALRLLVRRITKTRLWWDDWMALSTYVSSSAAGHVASPFNATARVVQE
jgi:hypothetical protein